MNSLIIGLIPKVPKAIHIENFHPIIVANFKFKIITKILADHLGYIALKLISSQQCGFVRGRRIMDYIGVTFECVNLLHKKAHSGNLVLKMDVRKAFDTLDWDFLLEVLKAFGFCEKFIEWIRIILESAKLSFFVNGKAVGFVSCSRGVC